MSRQSGGGVLSQHRPRAAVTAINSLDPPPAARSNYPDFSMMSIEMRALALIAALTTLASLFLPWFGASGFNGFRTPWAWVSAVSPDLATVQSVLLQAPPVLLAVMASIVLAGVFILAAALGHPSRGLAMAAGGLTLVNLGYMLWQIRQGAINGAAQGLGFAKDSEMMQIISSAAAAAGPGAWCWGIGSLLLFVTGAIGYGRSR